jgi:hypothetical protein
VIALVTDEAPISPGDTLKCPVWSTVVRPQMLSRGARLLGVSGSAAAPGTVTDLQTMAVDTAAIDAANGNAPLVFDGAGANASTAIENGVRTLAAGVPLDLSALLQDDASDAVDAVAAFVDHVETLQLGTPACANLLTEVDTNADTLPDAYVDVRAGTPVCWRIAVKQNQAVPDGASPQVFRAGIQITADGVTPVGQRDLFFLVPPVPEPGRAAQLAACLATLVALRARRSERASRPFPRSEPQASGEPQS